METRANYIAVGILTLVALAAAFVFIYWIGKYDTGGNSRQLNVRIQGSVSGLGVGSAVQFNGILVGRVTGVTFDPKNPRFVLVQSSISSNTPIRKDTRASIGVRGLSGGAFLQLSGGSEAAPVLFASPAVPDAPPPELMGDPSSINELIERASSIAATAERVMNGMEALVEENRTSVNTTIKNAETFSKALADNSEGVDRLLSSAESMAKSMEGLSGKLDGTLKRAEEIVAAIDPEKIKQTIDDTAQTMSNAKSVTKAISDNDEAIGRFIDNADKLASSLQGLPEQLSSVVSRADAVLAAVDPGKVSKTIDDLSASAESVRGVVSGIEPQTVQKLITELSAASSKVSTLVASIDEGSVNTAVKKFSEAAEGAQEIVADVSKVTSRFGGRAEEIDQMIVDASELAGRLNGSSKKLDDVINKINGLLGSGDGGGLVADARATLAEFRRSAQGFTASVASIAKGVNTFTGRGLRDTQGLISDARQSLGRIDRVIRQLENNPSSIITGGGSKVKESRSSRPRR